MDRALRFTDSWDLTWCVYEEPATSRFALGDTLHVSRHETRLCFATDMVTRCLEPCPAEWWTLAPERLEVLCNDAVPSAHHAPPAGGPAMQVVRGLHRTPEGHAPWRGERLAR